MTRQLRRIGQMRCITSARGVKTPRAVSRKTADFLQNLASNGYGLGWIRTWTLRSGSDERDGT